MRHHGLAAGFYLCGRRLRWILNLQLQSAEMQRDISAMKNDHSKEVIRLAPGVRLEPLYRDMMSNCRLLFMGDRYRQLLRAYPEAVYRLSRSTQAGRSWSRTKSSNTTMSR